MPAAPANLVSALRIGSCVRHLFFKMTHTSGDVFAWDGVGDYVFNGDTYLGVAGMADIGGVSNSSDIQNHAVTVKLNGVPLSAFRGVSPSIRNQTADLFAVWIDVTNGVTVASKLLFSGLGDFLTTRLTEDTVQLTATIRAPHADWSVVPRAYYTNADQSRLFPGDTGCDYTAQLENATIAGWQSTADTATALLYYRANLSIYRHIADGDGNLYGHPSYGCIFQAGDAQELLGADKTNTYKDGVLSNTVSFQSLGQPLVCNGVSVQLDVSLNAISGDGNPITRAGTGDAGDKLRKIGAIVSTGTAGTNAARIGTIFGKNLLYFLSPAPSGEDYRHLIFPDSGLFYVQRNAGEVYLTIPGVDDTPTLLYPIVGSNGAIFYEQGTENPVVAYTGGLVRIWRGGATFQPIVKSDTGVVVAQDSGNRIITGYGTAADPESFLRVWT